MAGRQSLLTGPLRAVCAPLCLIRSQVQAGGAQQGLQSAEQGHCSPQKGEAAAILACRLFAAVCTEPFTSLQTMLLWSWHTMLPLTCLVRVCLVQAKEDTAALQDKSKSIKAALAQVCNPSHAHAALH